MPAARLPEVDAAGPAIVSSGSRPSGAGPAARAPAALGSALLLICLYAAFDHGAVGPSGEERVQLALCLVAVGAAWAWLWNGTLRLVAPRIVWGGLGLLGAFAVWSGITLAWSVAPDQTWAECNRAVGYVLILILAVAFGASERRAVAFIAHGFLAVATAVSVDALAQKVLPGLHLAGLVDLNTTGSLPRLQEPLGYWNALALLIAMGAPIAFSLAVQPSRQVPVRIAALCVFVVMLETLAFTYSRGGVLALIVGLAFVIGLGGARLRGLLWLGMACAAGAPAIVVGLLSHRLTAAAVPLGGRERAGLELAMLLGACLLLLVLAARRMIVLERHVRISERGARRIARGLSGLAAAAAAMLVIAIALSGRGLGGTASHAWSSFTATRPTSIADPGRLLSADSENRWVWWKEAAGAFSDRPLLGWGAGSFGVVHLLYRRDTLSVQQPHSVPLQFLAETGLIGSLLALLGVGLLAGATVTAVGGPPTATGRLLAAGVFAGAAAYLVHELYDWDWDIPGVTLPALVLLGTLAGSRGPRRGAHEPATGPRRTAIRALGPAAATMCALVFASSVIVPRVASRGAADALITAAAGRPADLRSALAMALDASRVDPVSDAGLSAASTIEFHLGRREAARRLLLEAIGRDPADEQLWQKLTYEDFALGAGQEGAVAAGRALALDPQSASARALALGARLAVAPPAGSPTAAPTPAR